MTKIHELTRLGQAIWYDYIRRSFITSGELQAVIDQGVRGMTSNPTIFEQAIAGSTDYDDDLHPLVEAGKSADEIYEALALDDIGRAADLLRPVYDETDGLDGYVSIEVSPTLAYDTANTISEARRLFAALDRPNIMIKVPGTTEGFPAIEILIGEGINVNVTLLFSLGHHEAVIEAYLSGLEKLAASGGDLSKVASVASFFVSRVDTAVDKALDAIGNTELQGKIAVANTKLAYALFEECFSGKRWEKLADQGARVQRPLWASTSTKNPAYSATLYVDSLIGPHTVNTVPPHTLEVFLDHGNPAQTLDTKLQEAQEQVAALTALGIDLDAVTQDLQNAGVASFAKSFESLMSSIAEKRERLLAEWKHMKAVVGPLEGTVHQALAEMAEANVMRRIWDHDHTVWKPESTEITNRLGWLHIAELMAENAHLLQELVEAVRQDGYTHALLLGMGGSSLAPEVFRTTFGVADGHLDLAVLDSTDPGAVLAHLDSLDLTKTLFIVATKSGGTVETLSFFKFFYNHVAASVGTERAGEHFIAITDPGSKLVDIAENHDFRATFINDPNIGGRYSALSYFGLVPAALVGVDVPLLLGRAQTVTSGIGDNLGARLGAIMGELAKAGRDKITLVTSPGIASFADWVEQLIAESTGKDGKGILPVVGETLGAPDVYGDDRLFVYVQLADDHTYDDTIAALEKTGQPVVCLRLNDLYDLGGQFFLWEMATAVAGYRLGIQPFDQPNVESAKVLTRKMVAEYMETGALPTEEPALTDGEIGVYGDVTAENADEALSEFLNQAEAGNYVALQAYVQPNAETSAALFALRNKLRDQLKLATTSGYGPRFLHSTGQLHKGDGGNGLFIQFTSDAPKDADIPDEAGKPESAMTFGVLELAQAMGDKQALLDSDRRVIRFHLGKDVIAGLERLIEALV